MNNSMDPSTSIQTSPSSWKNQVLFPPKKTSLISTEGYEHTVTHDNFEFETPNDAGDWPGNYI